MKPFFLSLCLFWLLSSSFAQPTYRVYKGTIGKYPIYLAINLAGESPSAAYYYVSQKKIIDLNEGSQTATSYVLADPYGNKEKFVLAKSTGGTLKGTWTGNKKTLPVALEPVDVGQVKHPFYELSLVREWESESPLKYLISSTLSFKLDTTTVHGKHMVYWYKDNIAKVTLPRLDPKYLKANGLLLNEHLREIEFYTNGCDADGNIGRTFPMYFFGDSLVSFGYGKGVCYCPGAAHPFWDATQRTLDIHRGKVLEFLDLFTFAPTVPNLNNYDQESRYRDQKVSPTLVSWLRSTQKGLLETPAKEASREEGDCYYLDKEMWSHMSTEFMLNDRGVILFALDGANGYGPCSNSFVIPYSVVAPNIAPQYKKFFKDR